MKAYWDGAGSRLLERSGVYMGRYLDSRIPFEAFRQIVGTRFFVDKTLLLEDILHGLEVDGQRYMCIIRPRRFGKSVAANMLGAFLGKAFDSEGLFRDLAVSRCENYRKHLNQHHVIFIDFSRVSRNCGSYEQYIDRIQEGINLVLAEAYPEFKLDCTDAVWDNFGTIFEKTGERFVFVMDEWDAVFHMDFISGEKQQAYLLFLKNLLRYQGEGDCDET